MDSEAFWLGVFAATFLWGCASAATVMWLRALLRDAGEVDGDGP